jgi:predicted transcriptional regulator
MKTTIEMSDPLFKSAKELAQRSQTTLRALIEEGLRRVISDSQVNAKLAFKLEDASVGGKVVLMPEPERWQQLEEEHVIDRVLSRKAKRQA